MFASEENDKLIAFFRGDSRGTGKGDNIFNFFSNLPTGGVDRVINESFDPFTFFSSRSRSLKNKKTD